MGVGCSTGVHGRSVDDEGSALKSNKKVKNFGSFGKRKNGQVSDQYVKSTPAYDSGEIRFTFCGDFLPTTPRKSSADAKRSSFSGRAASLGLERAIEVLDAFGSGVANLSSSGFISGLTVRGNKISILAFEVANTITKGAALIQSLSKENVRHLKQNVFYSEGVQNLVSSDSSVLLSIAAADKREELDIFCREIIRFGNLCKDPQWHNLNRFFAKMRSEDTRVLNKEEADLNMLELIVLGHHTAELYHELNALDRFEHDYRQKQAEAESLNVPCGESLRMLKSELKHQKAFVMSLKRRSLWSKRMEEIVEKLVDVVVFIHQRILEVYGNIYDEEVKVEPVPKRLGVSGLALHYANLTNQVDSIASRPSFLPANTRDSLYNGLPTTVKNALRTSLRKSDSTQERSMPQIKAEMDRILEWLVPMAAGTSRMYRGFGWVGEWANTSNDFSKQNGSNGNLNRLQTLYHVDKEKIDFYILELLKWLHHLINATKQRDQGLIRSLPVRTSVLKRSPPQSVIKRISLGGGKAIVVELSKEERNLLERVSQTQPLINISKSQHFSSKSSRSFKLRALCRSTGSSPCKECTRKEGEFDDDDDDSDFEVVNRLDLAY